MSVNHIAEGFYNKLTNNKNELKKERMVICKACKLYKTDSIFGAMCNKKLYLNPETNETSTRPIKGYYSGCGCVIEMKARVQDSRCPLNKW